MAEDGGKVYIPSPPDFRENFLKRGSYLLAVCALGRLVKGPRDRGAVMWVAASAYMYFLSKVWRYGFKQMCAVFGLLGVDPLITRTDAYLEFGPVMGRGTMWVFAGEKAMRFIHKVMFSDSCCGTHISPQTFTPHIPCSLSTGKNAAV